MATHGSDDVGFLLIDGHDVLGVTTELNDSREAMTEETDALGDKWVEVEPTGIARGEIAQVGFFDDAADGVNDALRDQEGVSRVLTYGVEGNLVGQQFIGFAGAMQINYARNLTLGEFTKANARYLSNGDIEDGRILHPLAVETADGDTESKVDASQVWQVDASGDPEVFVDETTDFNSVGAGDWDPFPAVEAEGDYAAIGFTSKFHEVTLTIGTIGVGGVVAWEYWDGSAWTAISGVSDGTSDFGSSGDVTFVLPSDWSRRTLSTDSDPLYYIRARVTTVFSTNPIGDQGQISSSFDGGASSSAGGAGYLEINSLALGGGTDFAARVRDSADDVTFADLVTFAVVSTLTPTAQRVTVSGTVERYLASIWVFTGAGGGETADFMIGFVRN